MQIKVGVEIGGVEMEMLDMFPDNFEIYSVVLAGIVAPDEEPTDAGFEVETRLPIELPDEVEVMKGSFWLISFDEAVAMVVAVVEE